MTGADPDVRTARPRRTLLVSVVLVVAVCALANLAGLGRRLLWNPVEPRYAGVVAEMLDGGGLLVPLDAEQPYDQKAPLAFWIAWAGIRLAGERDLFWLRLPSALGFFAMALGTLFLGRRWFGPRAGLLAACMVATAWLPFWSGRFFHLDTLFGAQTVWLVFALEGAARAEGRRRLAHVALGGAVFSVALLTKGPLPLLVAAGVLSAAAIALRDRRLVLRSGLGWTLLAGLLVAAAWFVPAWRAAGDAWAHELAIGQGLSRIARGNDMDKHGPLYYPLAFLGMAGPWSLLVPLAAWSAARRPAATPRSAGGVLAWCWFTVVLVVLTLFVQRRSRYLMPVIPPTALLVGAFVDRELFTPRHATARARLACGLVAGALMLAGGALALAALFPQAVAGRLGATSWARVIAELAHDPLAPVLGALGLGAAIAGLAALVRGRVRLGFVLALCVLALAWAGFGLSGAPAVDRALRGDDALFAAMRPHLDAGRGLGVLGYRAYRESEFGFFRWNLGAAMRRFPCREAGEPLAVQEPMLLLVAEDDLERCRARLGPDWRLAEPRPLGSQRYSLFVNQP